MYFILAKSYAEHPSRHTDLSSYPRVRGVWWTDGVRFAKPFPAPVMVKLKPYDSRVPDMGKDVGSLYLTKIPLFKKELVEAFHDIGVTNLETYEAVLLDPDNNKKYETHVAVNIIGVVAAADLGSSVYNVPDNIPVIDVEFDDLVLDESRAKGLLMFRLAENTNTILVHESVKDYLEKVKGFTDIEFYLPEDVALG